jgi:hypothetical protein
VKVLKESEYTYLQVNYKRNRKRSIIFSVATIPAFILGVYFPQLILLLLLVGLILLGVGVTYLSRSLSYRAGIRGEEAVVEALKELDDSYYLINDIMVGEKRGNIDHVLLSPKGIFVIETKNYTGDVRCEGDWWSKKGERRLYEIRSVSKQATNNADYLSGLIRRKLNLHIPIRPICVFTNPRVELKLRKPTTPVLRLPELAEFVREAPSMTTLGDSEIQAVSECILGKPCKGDVKAGG